MNRTSRLLPLLVAACALVTTGAPPTAAAEGPRMIKDLVPGATGLDNGQLAVIGTLGSAVLFRADTLTGLGGELYRTNGTKAGTGVIKDINHGPDNSASGPPFVVTDVIIGRQTIPASRILISDGVAAPTANVHAACAISNREPLVQTSGGLRGAAICTALHCCRFDAIEIRVKSVGLPHARAS